MQAGRRIGDAVSAEKGNFYSDSSQTLWYTSSQKGVQEYAEKTGSTIYKYIQKRRLSLAAQQLAETDKPIIDIAYEAHYTSQQAFTLAFHQLYLCTPQTYRKNSMLHAEQSRILRAIGRRPGAGYEQKERLAA